MRERERNEQVSFHLIYNDIRKRDEGVLWVCCPEEQVDPCSHVPSGRSPSRQPWRRLPALQNVARTATRVLPTCAPISPGEIQVCETSERVWLLPVLYKCFVQYSKERLMWNQFLKNSADIQHNAFLQLSPWEEEKRALVSLRSKLPTSHLPHPQEFTDLELFFKYTYTHKSAQHTHTHILNEQIFNEMMPCKDDLSSNKSQESARAKRILCKRLFQNRAQSSTGPFGQNFQ